MATDCLGYNRIRQYHVLLGIGVVEIVLILVVLIALIVIFKEIISIENEYNSKNSYRLP